MKTNTLPDWFIGLIHCPNSGTELVLASESDIQRLRDLQQRGQLVTKLGRTISSIATQGLVSADGAWFYPVEAGIPCLLPDEAWSLRIDPVH